MATALWSASTCREPCKPCGSPPGTVADERVAARTADFDGEVLLLQGDSHVYLADNRLGPDDVTRVVVHGETLPFEYLRLTIDPVRGQLFTWERVQVTG